MFSCYYDPGISIFLSVDPLAEQFPNYNPYHYVHNNPINMIDPTGMSAEGAGDGDPDKQPQQPQKLLNIKIYGEDKSLYHDGKSFSFGNGGFRFYSEKGGQGDLSLLKGNSGEGELINADLIYAFANYTKGYGVGNTYSTVKQGSEFVGNIFEAFDKGQNIVEDINRNIDASRTNKGGSTNIQSTTSGSEKVVMQRIDYGATKPSANNKSVFHTPVPRDTTVNRQDAPMVNKLNTRDSLNGIKMRDYYNKSK